MINRPVPLLPVLFAGATLAMGLTLSGCDQKAEKSAETAAGGEVLPGSISDDMIDLDTSTAVPPLAPVKPAAAKKAESADGDAASDEEPEADAPAPAAAPAGESPDTE